LAQCIVWDAATSTGITTGSGGERVIRRPSELDDRAIPTDEDGLQVAAETAAGIAEQPTGFQVNAGRAAAHQHQVEGSMEVVTVLELVGAYSTIVREIPDIAVGEAGTRFAHTRLTQHDGSGITVDAGERGARDIVEYTRNYGG